MLQRKNNSANSLFRESVYKIALHIFQKPNTTFYLRRLARETGQSTTAVLDAIKILESLKIIQVEETQLTKNIRANLDSRDYNFYKLIFNLNELNKNGIIQILVKVLVNPEAIVLFGSFSRGEDVEQSDIDILVISRNTKQFDEVDSVAISQFENVLQRKINIHILPSLKESSNEFKNAVSNGIVLHGYLKVI